MSELSNRYQQIMRDLQTNIKDEDDKEFVISKVQELSMMFMDIIDRLTYLTDLKIKEVETQQKQIDERMAKLQKAVDGIENDIYEDEENYEFEITCPYCNHEFVTDINANISTDVECPECHNMIELDWNGEDEDCEHDCSCCEHDCVAEDEEEFDYDNREEQDESNENDSKSYKHKKNSKQDDSEDQQEDEDM